MSECKSTYRPEVGVSLLCELETGHEGPHVALQGRPNEVLWKDWPVVDATCSSCRFVTYDDSDPKADWWCDKGVSNVSGGRGLVSAGFGCLYHQPGRREA